MALPLVPLSARSLDSIFIHTLFEESLASSRAYVRLWILSNADV